MLVCALDAGQACLTFNSLLGYERRSATAFKICARVANHNVMTWFTAALVCVRAENKNKQKIFAFFFSFKSLHLQGCVELIRNKSSRYSPRRRQFRKDIALSALHFFCYLCSKFIKSKQHNVLFVRHFNCAIMLKDVYWKYLNWKCKNLRRTFFWSCLARFYMLWLLGKRNVA